MKKIFIIIFLLIYVKSNAQDINYAKFIIKMLSSPKFKGRGYVENGNNIAAKFIKKEYKKVGLNKFKNNYFQQFTINANTFPSNMNLSINDKDLIPGKDYIVDPLSGSLKGDFGVEIIKKEDILNQKKIVATIKAAKGKVLIIDETGFEIKNKEEIKKINNIINFLKYSPKITIAAIILFTPNKLTWSNATNQVSKPIFIVNSKLNLNNIKKISINIDAELIQYKTQNIIGYIKGIKEPEKFIVLTAHYDHLGKMGAKTYFPGANDNSSGVAMLLNLAKYYKKNPPNCSIVFMSLAAEEIGLLGAKHYVENPLFDLKEIKFLVNFDLAGTGDDGIKVVNGSVYKNKFDLLSKINQEKSYLKSVQIRGAACNSDHCMFDNKGVPCFYIYTLGGIKAYHDIYDKYETLPLTKFENYCQLMIDFFNQL